MNQLYPYNQIQPLKIEEVFQVIDIAYSQDKVKKSTRGGLAWEGWEFNPHCEF